MAYPENIYPTDPDLPAASNQVTFDVNLWNVITSYIAAISTALSGVSDNAGNINLASGQYIAWVDTTNQLLGYGGVSINCRGTYYSRAASAGYYNLTTQDLCFSAWIKLPTTSAGVGGIMAKRYIPGGAGYFFGIDDTTYGGADGVLVLFITDDTDTYILTGNTDLRDNTWHHVAGIIDRDTAANCKLYLDGAEDGATNKAGTLADVDSLSNSARFYLGSDSYAESIFDGQIADAKVYFAAGAIWTEAQILKQYENSYNLTAGLIGTISDSWFCDEKTGLTVDGSVNDLTLNDATAWKGEGPVVVVQSDNLYVSNNITLTALKATGDIAPTDDSTSGTVTIGGNLTVSGDISATTISETTIAIDQRAAPSNPADNNAYLWNDNGGSYDVGDIMALLTFGEVTKSAKIVDFA